MVLKAVLFAVLLFLFSINFVAQPSGRLITREEYIRIFKDDAIREMLEHGIPASITLAQGLLESNNGNSPLAQYANNHFGIKCHTGWEGPTFYKDDDKRNECFRKYYAALESFSDHSEFLKTRQRYSFLFELPQNDYKSWAHGLKKAGYATNLNYAGQLIKIIEDNQLHKYDVVDKMLVLAGSVKKNPETKHLIASEEEPHVEVTDNRLNYVFVKKGDTFFRIAKETNIPLGNLYAFNDLKKGDVLKSGEVIYLETKRNKAGRSSNEHMIKEGETMRGISQKYGIKLRKLYRKNDIETGIEPQHGTKLRLR